MTRTPTVSKVPQAPWTFLTNHSHVLLCLTQSPDMTLREVALAVGITERAVQRIVRDLEEAGILIRTRIGRRNRYAVRGDQALRHPLEAHQSVGNLLALLLPGEADPA